MARSRNDAIPPENSTLDDPLRLPGSGIKEHRQILVNRIKSIRFVLASLTIIFFVVDIENGIFAP